MLSASLLLVFTMNMGCATILHGTSGNIHVQSDLPGTDIYLDDEKIGTRDAVVEVSKRRSPIITVKKGGCDDAKAVVEKRFDGLTLLGLIIDFGLISILVVDVLATGAVSKFAKTEYTINPHCDSGSSGQAPVSTPSSSRRDLSVCGKAFDSVAELATMWSERNGAAEVQKPERAEFVSTCGDLPEQVQLCLTVKYEHSHHEKCSASFDALSETEKARLDALFGQKQAAPTSDVCREHPAWTGCRPK